MTYPDAISHSADDKQKATHTAEQNTRQHDIKTERKIPSRSSHAVGNYFYTHSGRVVQDRPCRTTKTRNAILCPSSFIPPYYPILKCIPYHVRSKDRSEHCDTLTFCRRLSSSMPPIHHVIFAGGREPVASHSTSYGRSEDSG